MTDRRTPTTREIGRAGVEAFFAKRVKLLGGHTMKMAPIEAGAPDRLVLMPGGRIFLVELKADDGSVSPIQSHWHQKVLRGQGVVVHVVVGKTGVVQWLRAVVNTGTPHPRRRRTPATKTA